MQPLSSAPHTSPAVLQQFLFGRRAQCPAGCAMTVVGCQAATQWPCCRVLPPAVTPMPFLLCCVASLVAADERRPPPQCSRYHLHRAPDRRLTGSAAAAIWCVPAIFWSILAMMPHAPTVMPLTATATTRIEWQQRGCLHAHVAALKPIDESYDDDSHGRRNPVMRALLFSDDYIPAAAVTFATSKFHP